MSEKRIFYVYVIFRPCGTPCYVGKGKGGRWKDHITNARNPHLRNIYARANGDLPIVKVREHLTEMEAFEAEKELIKALGRKANGGPLVNFTDGGDGVTGLVHSDATKALVGRRSRQMWSDPDARLRIVSASRKARSTEEFSRKRSELSKATWANEEMRAKMSEIKTKAFADNPELRSKIAETTRAAMATVEMREKVSAAQKKRFSDPEQLERLRLQATGRVQSDAEKAKRAAAIRGQKRTPEQRAKMSAWQIGRKMSEEACKKIKAVAIERMKDPAERERLARMAKLGAAARWGQSR